jgi:hypothetical protein
LILPPSANYRRGLFFGGESVAKQKSEPVDQVETVAVLEETPAGVQLPQWRLRPKGSEAWQTIEAETLEDAIRAFNGRGTGGRAYAFGQLEIEKV